jgi:hypothetical protein
MIKRWIVSVVIIIIILAAPIGILVFQHVLWHPHSTPIPEFFMSVSPNSVSACQGSTIQLTINVESTINKEATLNFILTMKTFNSTIIPNQQEYINYNFAPNPLIVPPTGKNCTLNLTINQNTPLGQYLMIAKGDGSGASTVFSLNVTNP